MGTQGEYERFGSEEAAGTSPTYRRLAAAVVASPTLLQLLARVPPSARQPNLLFGAVRYLAGPVDDPDRFTAYVERDWEAVAHLLRTRTTQTNEAGRCATLLPALATIPGPLALIEVGASAGLCLHLDRYAYDFTVPRSGLVAPGVSGGNAPSEHRRVGSGPVVLRCEVRATSTAPTPLPTSVPEVVWRAGVDLNPLDVSDAEDLRWLQALIWPEHTERQARLLAAAQVVAHDPAHLVVGDVFEQLPDLVTRARQEAPTATVVVFHSAVLAYLEPAARTRFTELTAQLGVRWISNEGLRVLPQVADLLPVTLRPPAGSFVLAIDGRPVALTGPHGQWIQWLSAPTAVRWDV